MYVCSQSELFRSHLDCSVDRLRHISCKLMRFFPSFLREISFGSSLIRQIFHGVDIPDNRKETLWSFPSLHRSKIAQVHTLPQNMAWKIINTQSTINRFPKSGPMRSCSLSRHRFLCAVLSERHHICSL